MTTTGKTTVVFRWAIPLLLHVVTGINMLNQ